MNPGSESSDAQRRGSQAAGMSDEACDREQGRQGSKGFEFASAADLITARAARRWACSARSGQSERLWEAARVCKGGDDGYHVEEGAERPQESERARAREREREREKEQSTRPRLSF